MPRCTRTIASETLFNVFKLPAPATSFSIPLVSPIGYQYVRIVVANVSTAGINHHLHLGFRDGAGSLMPTAQRRIFNGTADTTVTTTVMSIAISMSAGVPNGTLADIKLHQNSDGALLGFAHTITNERGAGASQLNQSCFDNFSLTGSPASIYFAHGAGGANTLATATVAIFLGPPI
jgi:hypothetical protein